MRNLLKYTLGLLILVPSTVIIITIFTAITLVGLIINSVCFIIGSSNDFTMIKNITDDAISIIQDIWRPIK